MWESDESGTLVLGAETENGVTICIDSKIVSLQAPNQPRTESKVVNIGRSGCCAIQGYIGSKALGLSITKAIGWIANAPNANAVLDVESYVELAKSVWNSHRSYNKGRLPNNRKVNHPILQMYCADLVGGRPTLRIICLLVDADGKPFRLPYQFNDRYGTFLRVDGAIDTDELVTRLQGAKKHFYNPAQVLERSNFDAALQTNEEWVHTLKKWHQLIGRSAEDQLSRTQLWTLQEALLVARFLFPHFTKYTDCVGPPFELRHVTPSGRTAALL